MTAWMRLPVPVTTRTGPVRSTPLTSGRSVSSRSSIGADGRNRSFCSGVDARDDPGGRVDRDDPPAVDDRDPVGEALGLLHEMGHEEDGDAPIADRLDELPRLAASLRVEARRQLVEDRDLRLADEGKGDREALLLAAGQLPVLRVALLGQPEVVDEGIGIGRVRVERREQLDGLDDASCARAARSPGAGRRRPLAGDHDPAGGRARGRGSSRRRACAGRRSTRRSSSCRRRSGRGCRRSRPPRRRTTRHRRRRWPP